MSNIYLVGIICLGFFGIFLAGIVVKEPILSMQKLFGV